VSTITDFTAVDDAGFPVLADAHICGGRVMEKEMQADHLRPHSAGGSPRTAVDLLCAA